MNKILFSCILSLIASISSVFAMNEKVLASLIVEENKRNHFNRSAQDFGYKLHLLEGPSQEDCNRGFHLKSPMLTFGTFVSLEAMLHPNLENKGVHRDYSEKITRIFGIDNAPEEQ